MKKYTKKNKKTVNKTRKLLGQGTFGCVYKPAFKCSKKIDINNISKVMSNNEANNEIKNFNIIDKIDPSGKFHIKLKKYCDLSNNNKYDLYIKNDCEIITYYNNYKNLIFKDGGKELYYYYSIIKKINNFDYKKINKLLLKYEQYININFLYKLLIDFKNLVDGLVILNKHGFIHFDIKIDNIVYKLDNENKEKNEKLHNMKLIDFSVSYVFKFNKMKELEEYANFFTSYSNIYPDELIFCDYNNFNNCIKYKNNNEKILNKIFNSYKELSKEDKKNNYILNKEHIEYYSNIINEYYKKYNNKEKAYLMFVKEVFNKLDIYSLGYVLYKIMDKYKILYVEKLNNEKYKNKFLELEKIVNPWLKGVLNSKLKDRFDVIKSAEYYMKIYNYCKNKY